MNQDRTIDNTHGGLTLMNDSLEIVTFEDKGRKFAELRIGLASSPGGARIYYQVRSLLGEYDGTTDYERLRDIIDQLRDHYERQESLLKVRIGGASEADPSREYRKAGAPFGISNAGERIWSGHCSPKTTQN